MAYSVGETVNGTVSGVTDYGAFVKLEDGSIGMIHISKLSREFVSDIRGFKKKGDNVEAPVISNENDKLVLSLSAILRRIVDLMNLSCHVQKTRQSISKPCFLLLKPRVTKNWLV